MNRTARLFLALTLITLSACGDPSSNSNEAAGPPATDTPAPITGQATAAASTADLATSQTYLDIVAPVNCLNEQYAAAEAKYDIGNGLISLTEIASLTALIRPRVDARRIAVRQLLTYTWPVEVTENIEDLAQFWIQFANLEDGLAGATDAGSWNMRVTELSSFATTDSRAGLSGVIRIKLGLPDYKLGAAGC